MKKLRKNLKNYITVLKKEYKAPKNSNEWLRDNFHIIEKTYTSAMQESFQFGFNSDDSSVCQVCEDLIRKGVLPDDDIIIAHLLRSSLSTQEISHLAFFINYQLLKTACEYVNNDEEIFASTINSLRKIRETDFCRILYETCETEKLLCQDPTGLYRSMSEHTKERYRNAVYKMAFRSGRTERETAVEVLEKAGKENRHIGFFLDFDRPKETKGILMLIIEAAIPLVASICISMIFAAWYLLPLIFLPMWECTKWIPSFILSKITKPEPLMSMDFSGNIPENEKTVIALSTLLPPAQKAKDMIPHLKQLYLSNRSPNMCICMLADLKSSKIPTTAEDRNDIKAMKRVITQLNEKYSDSFVLAVRNRRYSVTENEYTGHERKRGALTSLVRLIRNERHDFEVLHGDASKLTDAKYIMALDSDTEMPAGSLAKLIAIASHPLNRPIISASKQRVTSGYGIVTPKIQTGIRQSKKTHFSSLMAGDVGVPAYSHLTGEKYQTLFGESIFCGKGLIDVQAFSRLLCDRFPEQQILSHDIPEGIVLRTAFAGNVALTDSFPTNEKSYFSRQHRWIRGDVQNISLLTDKRYSSSFTPLGKWWFFDNIRRCVTPIISVAALFLSFLMSENTATVTVAISLLSMFIPDFISFLSTLFHGGISMISRLYFSSTIPHALNCLFKSFAKTIMLARDAFNSLDAVCRAFFRLTVSRRHLLEWTTAADSENKSNSQFSAVSFIAGTVLLIFGHGIQRLAGIMLLSDIPFSYFTNRKKRADTLKLNKNEKEKLLSYCSSMWQFYEDHCTKENNYLIPDNIQETPVYAVAKRTSPTNIGLMLCAFLAARDFSFISTPEMHLRLSNALTTVEKLPKYRGNLYNWYSTETLEILDPPFISAVDSGNFLCCLTALKEGIEEYANEYPPLKKLIGRIIMLIDGCDFGFLYSEKRKLFHVGFDTRTEKLTDSYFDLLMSEARMASYFAVGKGHAPIEHWETLGRTLSKDGRYPGPVSWSGTMFEYFMPALFIPNIPDTLGSEAVKFCIHAQKKRVRKMNIPYGISESGYYAFDSELNYQYKAHGVKNLSLRNTPFDEAVISPYSTFLTLPVDPHDAMHNLKRLEKLGTTGKYGFCEAIDFNKKRTEKQPFRIVRSYMSHHIGMSFLAADNCISDNIMQKRFMNDDMMAGKSSLLNEKIPSDEKIRKNIRSSENQQRPERIRKTKQTYEGISALNVNSTVLSNGEWSVFASDTGCSVSVYGNRSLFKCRKDPIINPDGIFAAVRYDDSTVLPFTDAPSYKNGNELSASFSDTSILYKNSDKNFSISQTVTIHPSSPCEMRTFRIRNRTKSKKSISLLIYTEPSIENINENIAHPAFSNMFLATEYIKNEKILFFTRKNKSNDNSICVALGLKSDSAFTFSDDREAVLSRDTGIRGVFNNEIKEGSHSVDKCIALQLDINIAPHSAVSETLLICAGSTRDSVINRIISLKKTSLPAESKCGSAIFSPDSIRDIYARKIIGRYLFSNSLSAESVNISKMNNGTREDLWRSGISGDLPVVLVNADKDNPTVISDFVSLHEKLKKAGLSTETVFLTEEDDNYDNQVRNMVLSCISDQNMLEKHGGIFILSTAKIKRNELCALTCSAITVYPEKGESTDNEKFVLAQIKNSTHLSSKNVFFKGGYMIGDSPSLPWCHVVANRNFGTLIADDSIGYTWALNSRENKLTTWHNDTRRAFGGEMLIMTTQNGRYDIIKGSSAFFRKGAGEYYAMADDLTFRTQVTVPGENMCKNIEISIINNEAINRTISLSYYVEPVMGDFLQKPLFIKKEADTDAVAVKNMWNNVFDGYMIISSDGECSFSFDKASFIQGKDNAKDSHDCIIITRRIELPAKSDTKLKYWLSYGKSLSSSLKMPDIIPKRTNINRIIINTPDKELDRLFNDFLPNQIIGGRIFGRTGFYQCSGAYGFRDQLQDAMSVCITHPEILRTQILRCAAAQFKEGDVLHWFHQLYYNGRRIMRGVRTLYSDDLLWLPLAVSEYCLTTGDMAVTDIPVPFIDAPILEKDEHERYGEFTKGKAVGSVYDHCLRAIKHACRFGIHGLPLIKGGDWNDSFNLVGTKGSGESVWLAMFMSYTLNKFSAICRYKKDVKTADVLTQLSQKLLTATDECAWDSDRYLRCFYDDGTPMGKNGNSECAIDLLPQAWSVISSMPDKERCKKAVNTAYKHLVDKENGIVKLFTPPFSEKGKLTGYVNRYPQGIRENGGQYTHGSLWLADAFFRLNNAEKGYELLKIMNPAKKDTAKYKTEPYYLAGDVYSAEGLCGRGGWSIYTGSAGWYYRTVTEQMLGIRMRNGKIKINPRLPESLRESRVKIILNDNTYDFELRR